MEVEVFIQAVDGACRSERLQGGAPISIGRSAQSSLRLEGDGISRTHVVVSANGEGVWVEDCSSNGTLAGEVLLRREAAQFTYGTPIVVGDFTIYVTPAGAGFTPPAAVPAAEQPPHPAYDPPTAFPTGGPPAFPSAGFSMRPDHAPAMLAPPSGGGAPHLPGAPRPDSHRGDPFGATGQQPMYRATDLHFGETATEMGMHPFAPMAPPSFARTGQGSQARADSPFPGPGHARPEAVVVSEPPRSREPPRKQSGTGPLSGAAGEGAASEADVALRREIHAKLLENLDLAKLDATKMDDPSMRPRVLTALRRIVKQLEARLEPGQDRDMLVGELADEALGLGPLERFLADPTVNEIMVVDPNSIYIEQGGRLVRAKARFTDDERVRAVIERIVTPLGRRIDESSPLVDARLKDGSRVNAIIRPLALRGSCITIRKFAKVPLDIPKLIRFGALSEQMARFLERSVLAKKNIIISGGTGSGKTTLLNVLSSSIPEDERIVTIEDAAELQLSQPHVVSLESRPPNMEGKGEYTIRDLVKNALRMRPDRIVVGECRGGEALDMLQAMNTGHDGSLTTTHANSPAEAIARIETLVLMGGVELPSRAIRENIANSIHLVVQQTRFSDGTRKLSAISEVVGIEDDGQIAIQPIFEFVRTGTGSDGKVLGEHRATGYLPTFLDAFIVGGLIRPGEPYL